MRALHQRLRKATSALLRGDVKGPVLPTADQVVTVAQLLYNEAADAIFIPMIPGAMTQSEHAESSIEFAAASVLDRVALAALVRRHRPPRLFEIGTFRGVTAVTMAVNAPSESVLYTLDLPPALSAEEIEVRHYRNATSGFHQMAAAAVAGLLGAVSLTVVYFVVLPPFAWLARRAERREPLGWIPISRDRRDSPTSQY
jgi:hypothetical protein